MVGAIASLLSGLNIEAYQTFITNIGLKPVISMVSTYTTNMIALYAVFSIGKAMADQLECKDQSTLAGLITLLMFLLVIPTGVGEGDTAVSAAISTSYFGAAGLFTAMLLGIVVPLIYNLFIKYHIVIKMPEGVPPQIANGFSAIIPAAALTVIFVVVRQLCAMTSFGTLNDLVYGILRAPLSTLTESPVTFVILLLLCNILWFFGIHGVFAGEDAGSEHHGPFLVNEERAKAKSVVNPHDHHGCRRDVHFPYGKGCDGVYRYGLLASGNALNHGGSALSKPSSVDDVLPLDLVNDPFLLICSYDALQILVHRIPGFAMEVVL